MLEWYGYHWHRAQQELNEAQAAVRGQETRNAQARARYEQVQAEVTKFRKRLSGLRGQLNVWHRESSDLHAQRESISLEVAVLDERRRALASSQQALSAE